MGATWREIAFHGFTQLPMTPIAVVCSSVMVVSGVAMEAVLKQRSTAPGVDRGPIVVRRRLWAVVIAAGLFNLLVTVLTGAP